MGELISQLRGPYFSFLSVEKEELWERRGRVQRIVGLKSEYYHHPNALRLPYCVISIFGEAFQHSHEKFAYYGYTVYESQHLVELSRQLQIQIERIRACQNKAAFDALLTELFIARCDDAFQKWPDQWELLKSELIESIEQIIEKVRSAQKESKELLVLGV